MTDAVVRSAAAEVQMASAWPIADSTGRFAEVLMDLATGDFHKLLDHAGAISREEVLAVQRFGLAITRYGAAVRREWHPSTSGVWSSMELELEPTTYYCDKHERHLPCRPCMRERREQADQ